MLDEVGAKTQYADISVYGGLVNVAGNRYDCPFRFPGQYEDEETGLYYNRFRYYDSEMGGYVSQDPIGFAGGNPTFYGYVEDPTMYRDILGLEKCRVPDADWTHGPKPDDMVNPHKHHIVREKVPPGWKNKEAIKAVEDSQAIIKKHGIDLNTDSRNFTWAQNGGGAHTQKAAINVADKLRAADKQGSEAVVNALDKLGKNMRGGNFFS